MLNQTNFFFDVTHEKPKQLETAIEDANRGFK